MKYFISNAHRIVYFLDRANGNEELMGVPISSDNTFDTDESFMVDFDSIDSESFIYCKGVEAFLKKEK